MKNTKRIIGMTLLFIAFIVVGLQLSTMNQVGTTSAQKKVPQKEKEADQPPQMVSLLENKASPDALFVKVGDSVQFNSKDGKKHHISSGAGNAYDENHMHSEGGIESGVFDADEGYKVTFTKTGTFEFHDNLNPKIFISVVVYKPE